MKKYILKRLLISAVILVLVAFIIYVLMRSLPPSCLEQVAGEQAVIGADIRPDPDHREQAGRLGQSFVHQSR